MNNLFIHNRIEKLKTFIYHCYHRFDDKTKIRLKFLFSHHYVFILMLFTGLALGIQLLLSFSLYQLPQKIISGLEKQYIYVYNVSFNKPIEFTNVEKHEAGLSYAIRYAELKENDIVNQVKVTVIDEPDEYHILDLQEYGTNTSINNKLNHGVIISKWLANKFNLVKGQAISVKNSDGMLFDMPISAIHTSLQGEDIFTTKKYFKKITNDPINLIDGLYTNDRRWQYKQNTQNYTVTPQQSNLTFLKSNVAHFKWVAIFILIFGVIIGLILLSIALSTVIHNNQKYALLLKEIGYSSKQVFKLTIENYLFVLLVGTLLSYPFIMVLVKFLFNNLSKTSQFYLPIETSFVQMVIVCTATVVFFYSISLFHLRLFNKRLTAD